MHVLSGTRTNYLLIYHIPANVLLTAAYGLWFLPLIVHNHQQMSSLEATAVFYGVLNVFAAIIIYTPFYMNRISVLYLSGDHLQIDHHRYEVNQLQGITRLEGNYWKNRQVYYRLKIGTAGAYQFYKVAERACWKAWNPLQVLGVKRHDHLIDDLRRLGVNTNVREVSLPFWGGTS